MPKKKAETKYPEKVDIRKANNQINDWQKDLQKLKEENATLKSKWEGLNETYNILVQDHYVLKQERDDLKENLKEKMSRIRFPISSFPEFESVNAVELSDMYNKVLREKEYLEQANESISKKCLDIEVRFADISTELHLNRQIIKKLVL